MKSIIMKATVGILFFGSLNQAWADPVDTQIDDHTKAVTIQDPTYQGSRFLVSRGGISDDFLDSASFGWMANELCKVMGYRRGAGSPSIQHSPKNGDMTRLWRVDHKGNLSPENLPNVSQDGSIQYWTSYISSISCVRKDSTPSISEAEQALLSNFLQTNSDKNRCFVQITGGSYRTFAGSLESYESGTVTLRVNDVSVYKFDWDPRDMEIQYEKIIPMLVNGDGELGDIQGEFLHALRVNGCLEDSIDPNKVAQGTGPVRSGAPISIRQAKATEHLNLQSPAVEQASLAKSGR